MEYFSAAIVKSNKQFSHGEFILSKKAIKRLISAYFHAMYIRSKYIDNFISL